MFLKVKRICSVSDIYYMRLHPFYNIEGKYLLDILKYTYTISVK